MYRFYFLRDESFIKKIDQNKRTRLGTIKLFYVQ